MSRRRGRTSGDPGEERTCASCGRRMELRRGEESQPDARRFCSAACRKRKVRSVDRDLEAAILDLLADRAGDATICPSEAARQVAPGDWRDLMEPARRAARRLVAAGQVEITQKGRPVDPSTAKGPIRVRRAGPG